MPNLAPADLDTLRAVHEQRPDVDRSRLQALVDGKLVEQVGDVHRVTPAGQDELRLARGFGEAIADALIPGVGAADSLRR